MREIKFRAWDAEANPPWMIDSDICGKWSVEALMGSGMEVMQYAGLKDMQGVEIYEGDIVRSYNDYWDGCEYLDLDCHFKESEWMFGEYSWCDVSSEKCKVIGNIYENPELLEVEG